jgi:pyruvate-formate lyase-activating enzyme
LAQLISKSPNDGERILFKKQLLPNEKHLEVIPAYELMDIGAHSEIGTMGSWYGFKFETAKIATVLSNRGCRAACTFCNVRTFNGKGVRHRSVDSVLDELELLKNKYGIGHIIWLDDDLLLNEKRAISLFNGMVERQLNMTWDATNGVIAASLNEEVVDAAFRSGCIGLNLGIESGNAEILKNIRKPGTPRIFRRAADVLKKYPAINTRALLIIGFPNETMGNIFDTIKLCEEMDLDWHNIAILQPWQNTPIYDAMVDQGLLGVTEGVLKGGESAPYQLGPYSRQRAIEQGKIQQSQYGEKIGSASKTFLNSDHFEDLDYVPNAEELDEIWFYMNFRLNFSRLLNEKRKEKLVQQLVWLKYVSEKTAPDNAIILYFYAYIQSRVKNSIDKVTISNLEMRLDQSEYWREKFSIFGLNILHVQKNTFPKEFLYRIPIQSIYSESAVLQ